MPDTIENPVISDNFSSQLDAALGDIDSSKAAFRESAAKAFNDISTPETPPQEAVELPADDAPPSKPDRIEKPPIADPDPEPKTVAPKTPIDKPTQFKQLKELRDAAEQRAVAAEKRIAEFESKLKTIDPEAATKLVAIQAERDDILARLEAVAAERSPRFEAQFKPRIDAAIQLAKGAAGPEHAEAIAKLMELPDSEYRNVQLDKIADDLTGIRASKFGHAIAEIDKIHNEKAQITARGSEVWKQWNAESQAQQKSRTEAQQSKMNQSFDAELESWSKTEMFKSDPLKPETSADVNKRIAQAKTIFSGELSAQELARASFWAAAGPDLVRGLNAERKRSAELAAEIEGLKASSPSLTGMEQSDEGEEGQDANLTLGQAVSRAAKKAGLRFN